MKKGEKYLHKKTLEIYKYEGKGKLKMFGSWISIINYSKNGQSYSRFPKDFFDKFEKVLKK